MSDTQTKHRTPRPRAASADAAKRDRREARGAVRSAPKGEPSRPAQTGASAPPATRTRRRTRSRSSSRWATRSAPSAARSSWRPARFAAFCLMAVRPQYRFGVPLGALAIFVATFGVLDLAGSFDDPDDRVAGRATLARARAPARALRSAAPCSLWGLVCLAVDGRLSAALPGRSPRACSSRRASWSPSSASSSSASASACWARAEGEAPRPLLRRHGFWLVVARRRCSTCPLLGSHSLSDPWETHYGEVSREILARNDWISPGGRRTAGSGRSPSSTSGSRRIAMATFGVHYQPDQMLSAVTRGPHPVARVGGAPARLPAHGGRGLPALQGRRARLRPARGAARRRRAR